MNYFVALLISVDPAVNQTFLEFGNDCMILLEWTQVVALHAICFMS